MIDTIPVDILNTWNAVNGQSWINGDCSGTYALGQLGVLVKCFSPKRNIGYPKA